MSSQPSPTDTGKASENEQRAKAEQVRDMFGAIAGRYDLLNNILSFGIDGMWRRELVALAKKDKPAVILDVATGTADLAIALKKALPEASVVGVDFAPEMLEHGRSKVAKKNLDVTLEQGDGQNLAFKDNSFDLVTIAYGIRNFSDRQRGLDEFYRVLKPGGKLMVLEFPPPPKGLFGRLFRLYFLGITPYIAGFVAGRKEAYAYLGESVLNFYEPDVFAAMLQRSGFDKVRYKLQTFGVSALHVAEKQTPNNTHSL